MDDDDNDGPARGPTDRQPFIYEHSSRILNGGGGDDDDDFPCRAPATILQAIKTKKTKTKNNIFFHATAYDDAHKCYCPTSCSRRDLLASLVLVFIVAFSISDCSAKGAAAKWNNKTKREVRTEN